jgi:hypothetical protein
MYIVNTFSIWAGSRTPYGTRFVCKTKWLWWAKFRAALAAKRRWDVDYGRCIDVSEYEVPEIKWEIL